MMVVAQQTAHQVLEVIERYVAPKRVDALLKELSKIPGNRSYRETINLLVAYRRAIE